MGNDYPDSVFTTEDDAEAYVACKNAAEKKKREAPGYGARIYWRSYKFKLEGQGS
jgi:hypothetical protein